MKKLFLFITLSIFCSTNSFSQKIGLGFQASIPSYGISLKVRFNGNSYRASDLRCIRRCNELFWAI